MTPREVFEKVKTHLLAQGTRAENANDVCMYRAPDGKMCAAGCLIADEHYSASFEGAIINRGNAVSDALEASGIPMHDRVPHYGTVAGLVRALQLVHDRDPIFAWRDSLEEIEKHAFGGAK